MLFQTCMTYIRGTDILKKIINVDLGEKSEDALDGFKHGKCVALIASWKYNELSQNV